METVPLTTLYIGKINSLMDESALIGMLNRCRQEFDPHHQLVMERPRLIVNESSKKIRCFAFCDMSLALAQYTLGRGLFWQGEPLLVQFASKNLNQYLDEKKKKLVLKGKHNIILSRSLAGFFRSLPSVVAINVDSKRGTPKALSKISVDFTTSEQADEFLSHFPLQIGGYVVGLRATSLNIYKLKGVQVERPYSRYHLDRAFFKLRSLMEKEEAQSEQLKIKTNKAAGFPAEATERKGKRHVGNPKNIVRGIFKSSSGVTAFLKRQTLIQKIAEVSRENSFKKDNYRWNLASPFYFVHQKST